MNGSGGGVCIVTGRMWKCLIVVIGALAGVGFSVAVPLALRSEPATPELPSSLDVAESILSKTPLIDG